MCSPARAGWLTGRYQQRFGHEHNLPPAYREANGLPLAETTLPQVLKTAGDRTIALGKWHLGYAPKFHPLPFLTGKAGGRPHQTLLGKSDQVGAVRDGDLKLVIGYQTNGVPELSELASDPSETTNLAASRTDEVKRLQKLFDDWGRDFPAPLWGGQGTEGTANE